MSEVQYLDFPTLEPKQEKEFYPKKGQDVDVFLTEARNSLLSLKDQRASEIQKHRDRIKEMLILCASFFSEADSEGMILIYGKDRDELMIAENIFNLISKEQFRAKEEKLQKLIEAITPALQLPPSATVIKQAKLNAAARSNFLEHNDTYSSSDICRINCSTATNKAALASGWRKKGRIFAVDFKGKLHYPTFQFDHEVKPKKIIYEVIKIFGKEHAGWQLALWFITPNAVLNGKAPIEIIASDPESLISAVKEEVDPTLC